MSKYEVIVFETVRRAVIVEAEGKNEAMAIGLELVVSESPAVITTSTGSKSIDCYDYAEKGNN